MATRPFLSEEFENEFGQIIKPGDKVVVVASGYAHQVNIRLGTYLGIRMRWGDKDEVDHVVVRVKGRKFCKDPNTGEYGYKTYEFNTRLPGCRIYPTSTPLADFAGKSL